MSKKVLIVSFVVLKMEGSECVTTSEGARFTVHKAEYENSKLATCQRADSLVNDGICWFISFKSS